jgi:FkbM family methyltransferase
MASALGRVLGGLGRRLAGKPRQGVEVELASARLGTEYGGYAVLLDRLGPDSVVYSLGLGEDISFDLELIERCGCQVFGFDPTPRSIAWVKAQNPPAQLVVQELGVAAYDGTASFTPPKNPEHISHSISAGSGASGEVKFEVRRLATLLRELGHERLDLLKMDIEGAEYEVVDDLLASGIEPLQLMLEFHHGMYGIELSRTEATLEKLRAAGYRIFDAQPTGREFSLVLSGSGPRKRRDSVGVAKNNETSVRTSDARSRARIASLRGR